MIQKVNNSIWNSNLLGERLTLPQQLNIIEIIGTKIKYCSKITMNNQNKFLAPF